MKHNHANWLRMNIDYELRMLKRLLSENKHDAAAKKQKQIKQLQTSFNNLNNGKI